MKWSIVRKRLLVVACLLLVAWGLTLGVFHDRSNWLSSVSGPNTDRTAFEQGRAPFCLDVHGSSSSRRSVGVPFLFYSTFDTPPYSWGVAFYARPEQKVDSVTVESLVLEDDLGHVECLIDVEHAHTSEFSYDDFFDHLDSYVRAPGQRTNNRPFWCSIAGYYSRGDEKIPFEARIRVTIIGSDSIYFGWMNILVYLAGV